MVSTKGPSETSGVPLAWARTMRGRELDGLFQATVDASEEAVLDSLWAAVDTTGREGRTVYAFPRGV